MAEEEQDQPSIWARPEPGRQGPAQEPPPAYSPQAWPPPAPYGQQPYPPQPYGQQPYPPPAPYGQQPPYGYPPAPYVPQQQLPSFPHAEPMLYHQMLRTWTYKWWRPLVGSIIVLLGFVLIAPLALVPVLVVGIAIEQGGDNLGTNIMDALSLEDVGPTTLLYLNLTIGAMIPITWFVIRFVHRMRPRWLASVMPKLRWKFLLACMGLAVLALIAQIAVGFVVPLDDAGLGSGVNEFTTTTLVLIVIVILTTPFQAAGEEYVFRGYLMQAVGSLGKATWFKWVAILVTSLIFALAHGVQNPPLFFDRFMFGLVAGWLVIRTGGLEAGIAMHVLNNFLAFGAAIVLGDLSESLTVSEVSWWNIPLTLTQQGVYAILVLWLASTMKLRNRTAPPAPEGEQGQPTSSWPVPTGA